MLDTSSNPKNLLLVVVDCLRADRCPADGSAGGLKAWPRLADGTVFTQTVSSASWTPVCFASLLSGQYSWLHGVRTFHGPAMAAGVPTLATVLQQAGYSTHGFFTGPLIDVLGLNRGFDEYDHRERDQFVYGDFGRRFDDRMRAIFAQGRPWFTMLHLFEVHLPRQTNGLAAEEHSVEEYDVSWRQLDAWLAALMDKLPPNTIVALTGDHGESIRRRSDRTMLGHMWRKTRENLGLPPRPGDWRRHGYHVFDEVLRIPWAICGPGVPRRVIGDQVRQVDIAPTLLDILGSPMPGTTSGRSVMPLIRGQAMDEAAAYVETGCADPLRQWHGLRTGDWKYAEHPRYSENLDAEAMLFNLRTDPQEWHNVIRRQPEQAIAMRRQLDSLLAGERAEQPGQQISPDDLAKLDEQLRALGYI